MKRVSAGLCLWAALFWPVPGMAQSSLNVALTATAPPFAFRDEAGSLKGFNVDLVLALCERLGRACKLEAMPFPEVIPAVHEGRFDLGVANTLKTPEREKLVRFTRVVWRSTSSLIGPRELGGAPPAALLATEQTCAIGGSRQLAWLTVQAGRAPLEAAGNNELLAMVAEDRCRLALLPTQQALPFLQSGAGQRFGYVGTPFSADGLGGDVRMAVRPDQPALLREIDQALEALILDGTHERLTRRYFPFGIL